MSRKVSWLGIFVVLPAFAGARLPAVNMSAGAVSARAEFGAGMYGTTPVSNTGKTNATVKRRVVARSAKTSGVNNVAKEYGEAIADSGDYLVPNRPRDDLWAKVDTPLRMPRADEFSVISSNDTLPEEDISSGESGTTAVKTKKTKIARIIRKKVPKTEEVPVVAQNDTKAEVQELTNRVSSLDAQIAKLIELQRKAEESAKAKQQLETVQLAAQTRELELENIPAEPVAEAKHDDNVKLSRMTVSRDDVMNNDVIIRKASKPNKKHDIQTVRNDMTKMSPAELRKAFRRTFLSENKHLSTYSIDDRFDVASDVSSGIEGFTTSRDLSEDEKIRPLEIKIKFRNSDSALSRDNYNLLYEYAGIVVNNPKRAIQVSIPESATTTSSARKLAARRLAIIEQVLRDTGVSEQRIVPVLSQRDDQSFLLRVISSDQYETLTRQKRNMFGDSVDSKTYKSMSW